MAYRGFVEDIPENLRRSVLGTLDFRGRSTRTELLCFMFIPQILVGMGLLAVDALFLDPKFETQDRLRDVTVLCLMVPFPALLVRRLHDQNRTGWWALLLLVLIAFEAVDDDKGLGSLGLARPETPWWLGLAFFATIIALWAFSLWPPSEGTNRYGPNPRLDSAESTV